MLSSDPVYNWVHPGEERLERYVMGVGSESDAVEEHLLICAPCRAQLRCVEEFVMLIRAGLTGDLSEPVTSSMTPDSQAG
jgi:hypothetical protein